MFTADIMDTGRILFTANEYDPTIARLTQGFWSDGLRNANRNVTILLFIQKSAYAEDSQPAGFTVRQTVMRVQNEELQSILEWSGMA